MFSFSPVGVAVALVGLMFIVIVGWRLTPKRNSQAATDDMFDTANYLVELKVTEDSKANGLTLQQLRDELEETIPVLAVVREDNPNDGCRSGGAARAQLPFFVSFPPRARTCSTLLRPHARSLASDRAVVLSAPAGCLRHQTGR